jgi:hypothetical protein
MPPGEPTVITIIPASSAEVTAALITMVSR